MPRVFKIDGDGDQAIAKALHGLRLHCGAVIEWHSTLPGAWAKSAESDVSTVGGLQMLLRRMDIDGLTSVPSWSAVDASGAAGDLQKFAKTLDAGLGDDARWKGVDHALLKIEAMDDAARMVIDDSPPPTDSWIGKMDVQGVTPESLADATAADVVAFNRRLHQLWDRHFAPGKNPAAGSSLSADDLVAAKVAVLVDLDRRGIETHDNSPLTREARARLEHDDRSLTLAAAAGELWEGEDGRMDAAAQA